MIKKFQKQGKTIDLDDTFSIWGALFGCFYPLYKGLAKSAAILFIVNIIASIVLLAIDPTIGLIINCAIAGFVSPKLMLSELEKDNWEEVK